MQGTVSEIVNISTKDRMSQNFKETKCSDEERNNQLGKAG
jgi:hypothetical protein